MKSSGLAFIRIIIAVLAIFAVIVTSPGRRAVTFPSLSTFAMRVSDDCQIAT